MLKQKFSALEAELNTTFLERREVIRGLLVGLLSRQHVLLLGPPGTAKSALAEALCCRIGGRYFRWLLARTSTPEELLGPISLKALENDSYHRVTAGKLPEADVAFLDEIWKANSAVLNSLLSILNERLFFNDGQPLQVPLQMAVGASNELPEDREELGALWDRFMLRYVVQYLRDPRSFNAMLSLLATGAPGPQVTITPAELAAAQEDVLNVDVRHTVRQLAVLRQKLLEGGITVSDRRWKVCVQLVQAHAWLEGRAQASDDDLAVLSGALWQEPDQIHAVRQAVMALANPLSQAAQDLLDQAMEIWQNAMKAEDEKATALGAEANAKLKRIQKHLADIQDKLQSAGKDCSMVADIILQVTEMNKEVIAKCLGIAV